MPADQTATDADPGPIVSADWLRAHLDDPEVAIVHTGGDRAAEYERGHLPGAVWAHGYDDLTVERDGVRALVPLQHEMEATLGRLGIDEGKRVVFVASGKSPWPARGYWVLRYYRFPRVHVADRSVTALERVGLAVTTEEPSPAPATCRLGEPDPSIIAGMEDVRAVAEGDRSALVVDCRADSEWRGEDTGGHPAPRMGRIPRAVHLDWQKLVNADGEFLPKEQLRALFVAAGIDGTRPVYPYCGGGIRAAVSWLAMHEVLGWDLARNYDGSWAEWSRREEFPIERG